MEILREKHYKTTEWDGGITREIWLEPRTGSYRERNFQVRISSAVIEKDVSDFTLLPGVHRFLMMQQGTAKLVFPNGREKLLEPLQVFEFEGEVPIRCYGRGTDLNLMLKEGAEGKMICRRVSPGETIELLPDERYSRAIYVVIGLAKIDGQDTLQAGETVALLPEEHPVLENQGEDELILAVFEWSK